MKSENGATDRDLHAVVRAVGVVRVRHSMRNNHMATTRWELREHGAHYAFATACATAWQPPSKRRFAPTTSTIPNNCVVAKCYRR
jgi:hypothetical protein